jgi:hypothetical protein
MDYDFASDLKVVSALAPAVYDSDQTSTALNTALYPFKGLTLVLHLGVGGITFDTTNRVDFKLTHSDDDSTYVAVTDDDVILPYPLVVATGGIVKSLTALHAAAEDILVGYRGKKQYVKVMTDFGGTHGTGTVFGITWLMLHPMSAPTWQTSVTDRPQI